MKICYLADINSYHTKKWCKYFIAKGYDVHVISISDGDYHGAKVHSLHLNSSVSKRQGSSEKLTYLNRIKTIKSIVKEINPGILHAHYASSYGLFGALCNYHPYVISLWGSDILLFPKEGFIQKNIIKYNLKKADKIFSTSIYMKKEAELYTKKKIDITPFGIDTSIFYNKKIREENILTIGIVKSLEKIYGIDYLIRAFANLEKIHKRIRLAIVGDGTQEEELKKLVKQLDIIEKVDFKGRLNSEEVADFYNRINIAVFPSISESFGVSVLEAQACGLPVIVSDIEAFKETTLIGKSSLVCKIKDSKSIEEELERLILDKELRNSMGKIGSEFVKYNFEENKEFEKIEKIYNEILRNAK
jgi:L-malate glycosyltransferase